MSDERQRVNIELDPELWKQVGIKAIEMGLTKRELTEKALREFIRKEDRDGKSSIDSMDLDE